MDRITTAREGKVLFLDLLPTARCQNAAHLLVLVAAALDLLVHGPACALVAT